MKITTSISNSRRLAFTLIELLVVMAVIAVLAAMIFPVAAIAKRNAAIKRVQTQLKSIESAIDTYKDNVKVYPPENPGNAALNPLFYELAGTQLAAPNSYTTKLGLGINNPASFFGAGVAGFVNLTKGSDDELQAAKDCISNIKPTQYLEVNAGAGVGTVLGVTDVGPFMLTNVTSGKIINPWRYTSTSATNNSGRYDLWVDVTISGKNYRICNWNDKYITLP